ncbi:MAG: YsnF/AvaK domain-containing protein [Bacillota bacterium]|nr:YsnF/AvaK domain-containing protein [Bacillota bacterium]
MASFWNLFGDEEDKKEVNDEAKLRLREEKLDIAKDRVQKGEVELGKEIVEERKIVDVPVTHEEVVVERRAVDEEPSDSPITSEETIRIPVSEERVDVGKHTVVTGEVSARKREIEDTRHIEETLKKEEARVHTDGDADIVSDDNWK